MITSAAIKIFDFRQNKEIIIPCHRHCDAFFILKEFGYKPRDEYKEIEQGFLNEKDEFLNRQEAWNEAYKHNQLKTNDPTCKSLFSEDLW